ncbi:MAG: tyrosine-type recombinase/integrase [Planctomycetes bacterium]|nr:tyrosine-type recombinase/integrase [Planctomycetota bacterium]
MTVNLHALRHTFASLLARARVPLIEAQKLMGHSDPKMTAELYTP